MTRRLRLIIMFGFFTFILTACGAQIHTETSFAKDGSGERTVILAIAKKDEGKISGGFEKLNQILKENAPSCMSVSCHLDEKNATMLYEMTYSFDNIEELKNKTQQITGKEPVLQWETSSGAFSGKISYYEETTTKELVQWAMDALQKNSISSAVISQIYEETESKVSLDGDNVWSGKLNAQFQVDVTPILQEVAVYTTYGNDRDYTKQIKLGFSYEDYCSMNTDEGLAYLKDFSDKFKVDETCNGYSVTLNSKKEVEAFLAKASDKLLDSSIYGELGISKPTGTYYMNNESEETIFSNVLSVTEIYNFNKLLAGFKLSTNRIKDYVFIPERESYNKEIVHHTYGLASNEYYNYIGEYDISDMYYLCFEGGSRATVKDAQVDISIDENMAGVQTVTLNLEKNGMEFTSNDIVENYSKLGEKVQFEDYGDAATIQFTKSFTMKKSSSMNLSRTKYVYQDEFSLEKYYPEITCTVDYAIKVATAYRIDSFSFGREDLKRREIKALKDPIQWVYTAHVDGAENVEIAFMVSKTNIIFYGVLGILILLFIGIGLSIYFTVKEKAKQD